MLRHGVLGLAAYVAVGAITTTALPSSSYMRGLLGKAASGSCEDSPNKGCPSSGDCPTYHTHLHDDGSTAVTIDYSCLKAEDAISYVVVDQGCNGDCDGGKTESVSGDKATYTYKLPAGKCTDSVCIYAKDGQFEHAPGPGQNTPECAYSTASQKCQICEYKVDIIAEGAPCDDGSVCTGPKDTCSADGVCVGSKIECMAPNKCKVVTGCDPVKGCQFEDIVCTSPGACDEPGSKGTCNEHTGMCEYPAKVCDTPGLCDEPGSKGTCDEHTGVCDYPDKVCNSPGPCDKPGSMGTCDEHTGVCDYPDKVCDTPGLCDKPGSMGTCDEHTGVCDYPGKACDSPLECNVQEDGVCDEMNGVCIYENKPDGESCGSSTGCDECLDGVCAPMECPCVEPDTCTADSECCDGKVCEHGDCVEPCNPPAPGTCSDYKPCCDGKVCEHGDCVEPCDPPAPGTCSDDKPCCDGKVCEHGDCVTPCLAPAPGQCSDKYPCCDVKICDGHGDCVEPCSESNPCDAGEICDKDGLCVPCPDGIGCAVCNANGLGVCVDVEERPGQSTCGVTCNAVCNAVCGTTGEDNYQESDCSNAAGGNCKGVFSVFYDTVDFMGGPCCKCKTGVCGNP